MGLGIGERRLLLEVAHASIRHGLDHGVPLELRPDRYPETLRAARASFVTLRHDGSLRGCIGALAPHWPLVCDTARHAFAAAFEDPRFPRLGRSEYAALTLHVSVLDAPETLAFESEDSLLAQLRPGRDGLIIRRGERRATFLPAVWESLPEPSDFLHALKRKAGMPPDVVPTEALRYTVESFADDELHAGDTSAHPPVSCRFGGAATGTRHPPREPSKQTRSSTQSA